MANNWRILDLTNFKGEIAYVNKRLQIVDGTTGEMQAEALNDVNIVFCGIGVKLAPAVMYHFASKDVVCLFCDWKGLPISGMYPWINAHGRVAARQRAQASLSLPRSKNAWARIVKAKINGQAKTLELLEREDVEKLRRLAQRVRSGDSENVEAQAARAYWHALFGKEGFSRLPGQSAGGRNDLLDYAYTILRGHSMRAVLSAGLTPALGMCHRNRANSFALADDLIEPFRPPVDYQIALLSQEATPDDPEVKKHLLQSTLDDFRLDGATIPTVMVELAQQFGRYVEGDVEFLQVPVWEPRGLS
jgi:CRISPR-associated protein Cas1